MDERPRQLARVALAGAILVFIVLVTSAYLRLVQGGLGCGDWPACYGTARLTQVQRPATMPPAVQWARVSHRFAATAVAAIVLAVAVIALRKPRRRSAVAMAAALGALTLFLALLGTVTPYSTLPAVTLGNVLAGMAMLGLFWWLWLTAVSAPRVAPPGGGAWPVWVLGVAPLVLQIALGALVNANFASRSCPDFPGCDATGWLAQWDFTAFNPWRAVDLPPITDAARQTLAMAHRGIAVGVVACWSALFVMLVRGGESRRALVMGLLLAAEIGLGVALVQLDLPRAAALAHHAVASLLFVAVLETAYSRSVSTVNAGSTSSHIG